MNISKINVSTWLEQQIHLTINHINDSPHDSDLLTDLDKYITMKKKYEDSIDHLGEACRVMESFVSFVLDNHQQHSTYLQDIIQEFLVSYSNKRS